MGAALCASTEPLALASSRAMREAERKTDCGPEERVLVIG
jgi:hypothetical protein